MDKILRVRMSSKPEYSIEEVGDYAGIGGRALTSKVIFTEVPPLCHPLGPENKLVIAPGLMSGSAAAISGRLSVGCKSPLTGTIKESNAGGQAAQVLAKIGYAAIILEGESPEGKLYTLIVRKDSVEIVPADDITGLNNYAAVEKLVAKYGEKCAYMSIGSAGERKMANSSIAVTDMELRPTRHCGRGGVGAVMASKGIKALVLDDAGCSVRKPVNDEAFKAANKEFIAGIKKHAVSGQGLPAYGTNVLANVINEAGGFPTNNFTTGQFDKVHNISGETQAETETSRGGLATHGCHRGCVIQCSGTYVDKDGNYITKQPEYETVWAHGANCGIDDLDAIARMDRMDDDFGLDTIEMGATIGVAMEAGLCEFGDAEGAMKLVREVGEGTPLGRILGSGAAVAAKTFGIERAPVVKGQAMPAYDPRPIQGIGVTYATTPMGADHTAGYAIATNILKVGGFVDPLKPQGQIELSRNLQIATAAIDSTGMCLFIAFPILDQPETFNAFVDLINAFHGLNLTADDVTALGKDILTWEREFNKRAGFTKEHDRLPMYFKRERLAPHDAIFDVTDEELDQVFNW
ncbi:aldehyde ferredoxin oxidoreductase family protein [Spirochaeta isovalerica]|uniref:Aldehyde:ferredoxin oxidoreductase n=1 Tax=Spirochaeta isovalerica TaxID=150 RepID=A0A841RB81_9SPIO|nr:aldehyde ferredoxin oxidoreductase C-terminal domain-containing protein [Spirochaeta isovalerica]MBB6480966.1 aldehyde:ferredoxin oxidoreductase [Spirochaeta isovalerica]